MRANACDFLLQNLICHQIFVCFNFTRADVSWSIPLQISKKIYKSRLGGCSSILVLKYDMGRMESYNIDVGLTDFHFSGST